MSLSRDRFGRPRFGHVPGTFLICIYSIHAGNSDSDFVNIGYDRTAISFVDLHTAEFKSNIALKQYAWPAYGILDENAAHLFITNLKVSYLYSCTTKLVV